MKKYGDYLVVGSGAVASAVMTALSEKGVSFSVSIENENYIHRQDLFDASTYMFFSGLGGLANYWHSVIDSHWFDEEKNEIDLHLLKLFGINSITNRNSEVIPLKALRPKSLFKKFTPLHIFSTCKYIGPSRNGARVYFKDGENSFFKKVFICTGALSANDILVNSGLATLSETLSDHVIGYSEDLFHNVNHTYIVSDRIKWGFTRRYEPRSNYKFTYRSNFSHSLHNPKDKSIYSGSNIEIIKKIFRKASISFVKEAMSLRYGITLSKPISYRKFYQINMPNCYFRKKNRFIVNDKIVKDTLGLTNENIQSNSLLSGIHFYNSLSRVDSDIVVRDSCRDRNIFLFTSGFDFNPGPFHFTYYLMKNAYISVINSIVE
jgi:hypothetical protein